MLNGASLRLVMGSIRVERLGWLGVPNGGTEAQQRAALHAHILLWLKARVKRADCCDLDPVPRTAPGSEQRQRPREQRVAPLAERHEDNVYQVREVARISAEMARPDVTGERWGGYTAATLRMVGLARAIQSRLPYLHSCTPNYCLKNRSSCRFFFPWPEQPYQVSLCEQ